MHRASPPIRPLRVLWPPPAASRLVRFEAAKETETSQTWRSGYSETHFPLLGPAFLVLWPKPHVLVSEGHQRSNHPAEQIRTGRNQGRHRELPSKTDGAWSDAE